MLDTPKFKRSPSAVDQQVGARVRIRRTALGMSQEKLGEALNVTFQQIQKYEKGTNRIGAGRLTAIAKALHVPVSFLFGEEGVQDAAASARENDILIFLGTTEGVALNRAFARISDAKTRRKLIELARTLGGTENEPI